MVGKIYQLYYWELFRYMKKSTGSLAEAEDIIQETFLRALEHSDLINTMTEAKCRAWLYRTAKNLLIDRVRHTRAEPVIAGKDFLEDDYTRSEVMQLCSALAPQDRAIFILRYFEGYNASELGQMFHQPASTIRARLLAARNKLKEFYPELNKKGGNKNE